MRFRVRFRFPFTFRELVTLVVPPLGGAVAGAAAVAWWLFSTGRVEPADFRLSVPAVLDLIWPAVAVLFGAVIGAAVVMLFIGLVETARHPESRPIGSEPPAHGH